MGKSKFQMSVDTFSLVGRPLCSLRSWYQQWALGMPTSMGINDVQSSIHMEEPQDVSYCHFLFKPYNIQFQSKWYLSSFLSSKRFFIQVRIPSLSSYKFHRKLLKYILRNERGTKCVEIHLSKKQHDCEGRPRWLITCGSASKRCKIK